MTTEDRAPVLVGVDGSPPSLAAIELGVREALRHERPLRLVHAFEWPLLGVYVGPSPEGPPDGGLAADADRIVADALAHAGANGADELTVSGEVVTGAIVPVLLGEATRAAMVVLGYRGLGGFTGLLVGSVAVQVAMHSPAPLLIARGKPQPDGPVLLGVDDSDGSQEAIEFGFAEAAAAGAELVALHVWSSRLPRETEDELPLVYDISDVEAAQSRVLAEAIGPARARWPQVRVRQLVHRGRASRVLVEASAGCQLVVVGARGRGGFAGLLLGSVSQAALHHAHCTVAIVRR
jgi:nucleotide-binding universal stress UspA family protein